MKLTRIIALFSMLTALLAVSYFVKQGRQLEPVNQSLMVSPAMSHDQSISESDFQAAEKPTLETPSNLHETIPDAVRSVWTAYQLGDYLRALQSAKKLLESGELEGSNRNWIQRQIPIISVTLAWQYIQTSRCQEAMQILDGLISPNLGNQQSISVETKLIAEKGAAICFFKAHRYVEAEQFARNFARQHPGDADIVYVLSQSLEANLKFDEARALVQSFLNARPDLEESEREQWQARLQSLQAKKTEAATQSELVSQHVQLFFRSDQHGNFADQAIEILESSIEEFHAFFGLPIPNERLRVHLYTPNSFHSIAHGPTWAQGIYDGHIRIPIQSRHSDDGEEFSRVLRHELVHALLSFAGQKRNIPSWFNEGLAIFLECRQGCRDIQKPNLYESRFLSLQEFEESFLTLSQRQAQLAYNQSLYLIQSLVEKHGIHVIHSLMENLPEAGPLNSNTILQSIEMDFSSLHALASQRWQNP